MHVTLAAHAFEQLAIMTLAPPHNGSQDKNLLAGIVVGDHLDDFLFRVFHHRFAGHIAIGTTGTGKEQSQIVIDLGGGAYG